jgi:hypothetical protein
MTSLPGKPPSYADILKSILPFQNGPLLVKDLLNQILEIHPSMAKNPSQAVLNAIRWEEGRQFVYLDKDHILPLRLAFQGARYRLRLTREEVDQTALPLPRCFQSSLPSDYDWENVLFIDSKGEPIPSQVIKPPHEVTFSSAEKVEHKEPVVVLKEWFHSQKLYFKDHILVTIKDWEHGIIRMERERFGDQHADQIAERNLWFADQFYAMLETAKFEEIDSRIVLPAVYAHLPDKAGIPPDYWMLIVNNDPRMITYGWDIRYSDSKPFPIEKMIAYKSSYRRVSSALQFLKEKGQKVFRLRAQLADASSTWREIEILGSQSITDLDSILWNAFEHDDSDHLSGFWNRIVRGGGIRKRYREVEIGDVNPFEPTEEEGTKIGDLKLNVGDQLKYVFDFGDWIEHTLELKSIGDVEKGVHYSRLVARNKPKYVYCKDCAQKGKQTIATYICLTCSDELQQDILLCENCLDEHEDHDIDEIIY